MGLKRDLKQFKQRYITQIVNATGEIDFNFSLNSIIQIPTFPGDNGSRSVDWANANWGTKWDVMDVSVDLDYFEQQNYGISQIDILCNTAWSPPQEAMQLLSSQCPNLYIKVLYEEPGVNFAGLDLFHNGDMELGEIDDLMTEEYIQEQNQLEENGEDGYWDVENPYLGYFEDDSEIIYSLSNLPVIKRRRAKRLQQVILFDAKKFQKYNRSTLIKYLTSLGKKVNRNIGKQASIQLIFSIINKNKVKAYTCPICFTNDGQLKQLKCKHIFCNKCITHWTKDKKTCPLCRADI